MTDAPPFTTVVDDALKRGPAPTPYRVERWRDDKTRQSGISIKDANGLFIANMVMQPGAENELATAQFLVRAANAAADTTQGEMPG